MAHVIRIEKMTTQLEKGDIVQVPSEYSVWHEHHARPTMVHNGGGWSAVLNVYSLHGETTLANYVGERYRTRPDMKTVNNPPTGWDDVLAAHPEVVVKASLYPDLLLVLITNPEEDTDTYSATKYVVANRFEPWTVLKKKGLT